MSLLSEMFRKKKIKDRINKELKEEVDKSEARWASIIFEKSGGRISPMESKQIAIEICLDIKAAVEKVF